MSLGALSCSLTFKVCRPGRQVLLNVFPVEQEGEDRGQIPRHRPLVLEEAVDDGSPNIVCARCYSLSHYGHAPQSKLIAGFVCRACIRALFGLGISAAQWRPSTEAYEMLNRVGAKHIVYASVANPCL